MDSETKKSDRLEFETKKLLEKVEALSVERDRLQSEKDELKEKNLELVDEVKFGEVSKTKGGLDDGDDLGKELTHQAQRSRVVINIDDGVRPYMRTISQNKLMTDYAVGPVESLNLLDLLHLIFLFWVFD